MKKTDFSFYLPPELIAQTPIPERDHSRLLCLDRETGAISHRMFYELPSLLREGDCLVVNDSRVPGKLQAIEWLSSRLVGPLVSRMDAAGMEYRLLLLSDHKTLTATRGHAAGPVPYLLYDSRTDTHRGGVYTEAAAVNGPYLPQGWKLPDLLFEKRA